jgi:hypothetical protein
MIELVALCNWHFTLGVMIKETQELSNPIGGAKN